MVNMNFTQVKRTRVPISYHRSASLLSVASRKELQHSDWCGIKYMVNKSSLSCQQIGLGTSRFLGQQVFSHLPTEWTWNLQIGEVLQLWKVRDSSKFRR
ncbi:uncharacterized protein [Anabrus simplex]|uniref:uncharacterized protein n=1 Tax=Anabrus simplex TaxID=316456 RepID=UPI0035A2F0D6